MAGKIFLHRNGKHLTAMVCFFITTGMLSASAQVIRVGPPEQIYSNSDMYLFPSITQSAVPPSTHHLVIDAPAVTLKRNSTQMNFFVTNFGGIDKYYGSLDMPFGGTGLPQRADYCTKSEEWPGNPFPNASVWIPNVYKVTSTAGMPSGVYVGDLLAFVHVERSTAKNPVHFYDSCTYSIGLAYSRNSQGAKTGLFWVYCGDIIQPYELKGPKKSAGGWETHNIGGIPYVTNKTNDSFYVYFDEYVEKTSPSPTYGQKNISVARAKIFDVLKAASSTLMPSAPYKFPVKWQKWTGTSWSSDAMASKGANIIPVPANDPGLVYFDVHSDAAYCSALKKYVMTVNTAGMGKLLLYTSANGINWGSSPYEVEPMFDCDNTVAGRCLAQPHSFIASLDADASDDCHIVGTSFYIYYPRNYSDSLGAGDPKFVQMLFRRRMYVLPGP
jgi:hypothetical protein